jgi:hypothetical protein
VTFDYDDESDAGPYPIPPDGPIEVWPQSSCDRHVIVIDVDIRSLSPEARVIATALRKYGMLLADNGSPFYMSGAPDSHDHVSIRPMSSPLNAPMASHARLSRNAARD